MSTPAPGAPFWVIERVKYLDGYGWDSNVRPVYIDERTSKSHLFYTQDIGSAKKFAAKPDGAEFLKNELADNEAFDVREHMMIDLLSAIPPGRAYNDKLVHETIRTIIESYPVLRDAWQSLPEDAAEEIYYNVAHVLGVEA